MIVITPTIGRVVWFWPARREGEPYSEQPFSASVVYVWGDRLVNLAAFDHNGTPESHTSVPLVQEGDPKPEYGFYAQWMPYQVGQAKKHEGEKSN